MKLARRAGAASEIWQIFVRDSSSTTGAGLTGLTNASSGLTAYYHRDTDTTATAISLVTMTVGTFTSSGFKEIDATNMPGWYQFCPPNAALAAGAKSCAVHLKGATNMAPLPVEVDLDAQVDTYLIAGTTQTARDLGASVLLSVGTGTGQVNLSSGKVPATLASTDVTGNVAADLQTIKTQTVTCAAGVTVLASVGTAATSTAQTGDCFARLGAPAGASVSADVAAIKSETDTILADVNTGAGAIYTRIGAPAGASIAADIAAVKAETDGIAAIPTTKTGYSLASTGLNLVLVDGVALPLAVAYVAASAAGLVSGAGSGTEVFKGLDAATTRLTVTVDASGNRSGIVYG